MRSRDGVEGSGRWSMETGTTMAAWCIILVLQGEGIGGRQKRSREVVGAHAGAGGERC